MAIIVTTGLIGLVLASYLKLSQSQNEFTARSQTWNHCISLVEAGVEEALAQLNSSADTNLMKNGWATITGGFQKTRELGDGYYYVKVEYTNVMYVSITATGYLPAPPALASGGGTMMAAAFVPDPKIKYLSRSVRVKAYKPPALTKGLVARTGIDLGGNQCLIDSYNSKVGMYNALLAGDKGDVAVNGDLTNLLSVGNAKIKGKLFTGPNAKLQLGPNGCVGSLLWHASGKKGIEPGYLRRDMNMSYPDVSEPYQNGTKATGNGGWKYILTTDMYELGALTLNSSEKMHIQGKATLYVKGNVDITGQIKIDPGASLTLYIGGNSANLAGTYDKQDVPREFKVYGLPHLRQISISGVALALYAPNANLSLNGSGEYYGSAVVKSVTMKGNTGFHYDESLADDPEYKQYIITSWIEI